MRSLSLLALLFSLAVHSTANSNSQCSNDQSFSVSPTPKTVSVGDTVELECRIVDSTDATVFGQGWEFYAHEDSEQYHLRFGNFFIEDSTGQYNYSIVPRDGGYLAIDTASVFHHGYYRCVSSCIVGEFVTLTVIGKVMVNFTVESDDPISAGDSFSKNLVILGAPEPSLVLEKASTDSGLYETFDDSRVILNSTSLSIPDLRLSDSGTYRIVATNSEGVSYREFSIEVTGVDPPEIDLSHAESVIGIEVYNQLDSEIIIECSIPETAYDSEDAQFMLRWLHGENEVPLLGSIRQLLSPSMVTVTLTISVFEESANGLYTCEAVNSNAAYSSSITLIGPPGLISPQFSIDVANKQVTANWSEPNTYGSAIRYYLVQYSFSTSRPSRETTMRNVSGDSTSIVIDVDCPSTELRFMIAAFNDLGIRNEYSDEESVNLSEICQSVTPSPGTSTTSRAPVISVSPGGTTGANTDNTVYIAAGAAGGLLALVICVSVLIVTTFCYISSARKGANMSHERRWNQPEEGVDYYSESPSSLTKSVPMLNGLPSPLPATPGYGPVYIDPQFEFPRENLELTDILYDGTFTVIYKATAVGIKENKSIEVAVKAIKDEYLEMDDYVSTLILEIEQLGQLGKHANIVSLLKVCTVGRPVYMVTEYMCHGDLLGFLRSTRKHTDMYTVFPGTKNLPTHLKLTSRDLLHIITQIVNGMIFLSEKKVVHGALCARNILVGTSMEVKIFNIGVQNLDNDESVDSLVRWMAPEVFMDSVRTMYGDVWSFGVLMWEVITVGGTPYAEINLQDLYSQLVSGMRLNCPTHCAQSMYEIMRLCWEDIPQHRPLFSEIRDHLDGLKISKTSYLDLRSYNDLAYSQFEDSERQLTSNL